MQWGGWLESQLAHRRPSARLALAVACAGPLFAIATILIVGGTEDGRADTGLIRMILLADLCYILVALALIIWRIAQIVIARRTQSAGSRLHLRLTGVFTLVALAPTIIVAVFATVTVNFGVEAWFSDQVGSVVRNSLTTAEAYAKEHRRNIRGDVLAMANDLNRARTMIRDSAELEAIVRQQAIIRELPEAFVFDSNGSILARGELSFLFAFETPTQEDLSRARRGEVVITEDEKQDEMRALVFLANSFDAFLYVSRRVDGEVLSLLDETRDTVSLYERLEVERGRILFDFALIYVGFALLVMVAAVWMGLWFAERIAQPIGRLAGAAQRVGAGDFDVKVKEERGDDEIAILSRVFNRMTRQVKGQRDALVSVNEDTDRRRRFMETVLSSVTAGVIGLDEKGRVEIVNLAAARMLDIDPVLAVGKHLNDISPIFSDMLHKAQQGMGQAAQVQAQAVIKGEDREFVGRIAPKSLSDRREGLVLTFDDMTQLASAQRMAAWGDVARRVAHEIKNPLTPIQLSVERLRRKFGARIDDEEERKSFAQYAEVITRQAGDIRRMVDEFSKFARMPSPERKDEDLADILSDAVLLQRSAGGPITFSFARPEGGMPIRCDRGMISQALTNLLQNAADSIETRQTGGDDARGEVTAALKLENDKYEIRITDNGAGLPKTERARLMEPYVTTRAKGTGLGLAIVKKIVEQHHGEIDLGEREDGAAGAQAVITLSASPAAT